jgi:hypothetical protein
MERVTGVTRVTLVIPKVLWEELKDLVPSGQRSRVVAEALEAELRRRRRQEQLSQIRTLHDDLSQKYGVLPTSAAEIEVMRGERENERAGG